MMTPLSKAKKDVVKMSHSRVQRVTHSFAYEILSASFILLNAVFVAVETEYRANQLPSSVSETRLPQPVLFTAVDVFFCCVFTVDLFLRFMAEQQRFFCNSEKYWNLLDVFVVFTAGLEVIVSFTSATSWRTALRKFSMLRVVRLLRILRMQVSSRMLHFVRELRLMVCSLTGALKPLAWAVVLMVIILLVFAVSFTDGVVAFCLQGGGANNSEERKQLIDHFGTLGVAALSLFQAMSGGDDWANFLTVLRPLAWYYHAGFLVYIIFAIFALMNVITAVFLETAMRRSQDDRELVVQQELEERLEFTAIMQEIFEELDTDGSGALGFEEFEDHIGDERLKAYLHTLELDVTQIKMLFKLLDTDQGGEVDLQEFVNGCIRLKGGAKSIDMAFLKYQVDYLVASMASLRESLGLETADAGLLRTTPGAAAADVLAFPSSPPVSMTKEGRLRATLWG